jgi:hypothetical protein
VAAIAAWQTAGAAAAALSKSCRCSHVYSCPKSNLPSHYKQLVDAAANLASCQSFSRIVLPSALSAAALRFSASLC